MRWTAWNDNVATFLSDVPVLHREGKRLIAVTATGTQGPPAQEDADRIQKSLRMRGIERLVIAHGSAWPAEVVPPPSTVLIGAGPLPAELLRT